MKKILFATTALVATAGVAAADVTFGGVGRFGVDYNEANVNETTFTSRFRLIVTGTAESDNGLSFGAQIRYQADGAESAYTTVGGFNTPRFWVSTGGFTVSFGNVLGAIENMPGMYAGTIGLTGLGFANVVYAGADGYSSGGAGSEGLDVIWSGGAWGVHLSHSWDPSFQSAAASNSQERTALAVSYSMGNWTFALAGQDSTSAADTDWALTVGGSFGNWDVTLQYADNGTLDDKYGIGFNWEAAAGLFIRGYVNKDNAPLVDDTNAGIGFQYRMGGGTFIEGGVADVAGNTRADLGLRFSF